MPPLPTDTPSAATLLQRLRYLAVNAVAFLLCYPSTNWYANRVGVDRHLVMDWEAQIPFVPWMIVPYMSSGLLLCICFAAAPRLADVRLLAQRLLLATVLGGLVFMVYPLRFSLDRPVLDSSAWTSLFGMLALFDQPYNQLPSLHVAYCFILGACWRRWLRSAVTRTAVLAILTLVSISTLFTYQHHVLDVLAGVVLGWVCVQAVRSQKPAPRVAFYYCMGAGVWLVFASVWLPGWLAGYGTVSLLLVARAYAIGDPDFLRKRAGRYGMGSWFLYAPYLTGYWLTWVFVQFRERRQPAFQQVAPQLWVGRRLNTRQARELPPHCTVIDMANELQELAALRTHRYYSFPMLDLVTPAAQTVQAVVSTVQQEIRQGHCVYLHCAMGYSRGRLMAQAYLHAAHADQPIPSLA